MSKGVVMRRFVVAGAMVLVLVAVSAAGAVGSGWAVQPTPNPSSTANELGAVSCASGSACAAVGQYENGSSVAVALAERWNGTKWKIEPIGPVAGYSLNGVSCAAGSSCIAVGSRETRGSNFLMLVERWNGTKWTMQRTARHSGAAGSSLAGVACASKRACMAVGFYTANGTGQLFTLAERWNGIKWTAQHTPNPKNGKNSSFSGVSCASKSACTAVGSYHHKSGPAVLLAERWNGTRWTIQQTPKPAGAKHAAFSGVSCVSARACTAVGSYYNGTKYLTFAERWNGIKWKVQHTPNPTGATASGLSSVSCESASACSAVGISGRGTGPSEQFMTLAERWNGTKWKIEPTPDPGTEYNSLAGVSCFSRRACVAVGFYYSGGADIFTLAERRNGG